MIGRQYTFAARAPVHAGARAPVFDALVAAVTHGGRIPWDIARFTLTPLERVVVQSIRFPGGLTLTDLRTKQRRHFASAYDVPAVRSTEEPRYDGADTARTIQHGVWMGIVLKNLADRGAETGTAVGRHYFGKDFHLDEAAVAGWGSSPSGHA